MATYEELYTLRGNGPLQRKIAVALTIAADIIRQEPATTNGHADRVRWAEKALANLDGEANKSLLMILAVNKGATIAQITGASDSAIQTNVDSIVNILAGVPNV